MFIGHFAVGFASKRWAPRTSLGLLLLAPLLLDGLWPVFSLLGLERFRITPGGGPFNALAFDSYPWSHSLLMAAVWGAALAGLYLVLGGERRVGIVLGAGVVSHWVLDWITHIPDLPLWPGGPKAGLGLWGSVPGTVVVEVLMLAVGAWLYLGATRSKDRIGKVGPWAYLGLLIALYGISITSPPPPVGAERLVSIVDLVMVLLVPLAAWVDRHRVAAVTGGSPRRTPGPPPG
jgi:LexA-binding, inner membrane-associated putative hydrolase